MAKRNKQNDLPLAYLNIKFNEQQLEVLKAINSYRIIVLSGGAGTGKTMLAVYAGLKSITEGKHERLIVTRPAVATEELGFMPGDVDLKFTYTYLTPIIDFVNDFGYITHKDFDALLKEKKIIPKPLAFMRGFNANNSFIVLDESQNITEKQMLMALTRIGKNSTMVVTGDERQSDLDLRKHRSGFDKLIKLTTRANCQEFIQHFELSKIERDPIIETILKEWEKT